VPAACFYYGQILMDNAARDDRPDIGLQCFLQGAAANGGSVAARLSLAQWMVEGRGGAQNNQGVFDLMKIVSVNGIPPAQINLACLYQKDWE